LLHEECVRKVLPPSPASARKGENNDQDRDIYNAFLQAELSPTDLHVYLASAYFRLSDTRFYVPVSVVVPVVVVAVVAVVAVDKAPLAIADAARPAPNDARTANALALAAQRQRSGVGGHGLDGAGPGLSNLGFGELFVRYDVLRDADPTAGNHAFHRTFHDACKARMAVFDDGKMLLESRLQLAPAPLESKL
jgi:hypothetical protein